MPVLIQFPVSVLGFAVFLKSTVLYGLSTGQRSRKQPELLGLNYARVPAELWATVWPGGLGKNFAPSLSWRNGAKNVGFCRVA